jgi:hypothetical protein
MSLYDDTFEWQQFPEGRARFSGSIRGDDERGHDTFAIEIDGSVTYGEIDSVFLPNDNDFNVRVVTYGYGMRENVGILNNGNSGPHAQGVFPPAHLQRVQVLVTRLIRAGLQFEDRPVFLDEFPGSHFQGKVIFPAGWAVGADAAELSA